MPWEQRLDHPANDLARELLQVTLAGTGVRSERRFEQRRAGERPHRGRARRVAAARRARSALALRRLLPGLGPASRASRQPVRGRLRVAAPAPGRRDLARPRLAGGGRRAGGARRAGDGLEPAAVPAVRGLLRCRATRPRSSRRRGSRGTSCSGTGRRPSMSLPDGVEILGPAEPRFDEILTDEALAFVAGLQREFGGRRAELLEARAERQTRLDEGERPAFLEATRSVRESDVDGRTRAARPAGPPRRDHRPHRPQDGDQRAQQRRDGASWPTSRIRTPRRGRTWSSGQVNLADAVASHDRAHRSGRARVPARRPTGDAPRPPARLAPARTPPARRRRAGLGRACSTSGSRSSTTRANSSSAARARTSTCRSSRAISRRACGTTSSCGRRTGSGSRAARSARPS